ncbi:MAG: N-acetyl-gamma-glutamyl-phosphate reductase [Actinomycetota bacterium]|nr:N-acetyl-gamma-glutamyl-phosphate reductase [Actinomycetota bacterium]
MGVTMGIIGASGYTGAELLRLADAHPDLDVRYVTADTHASRLVGELYPSLHSAYPELHTETFDVASAKGLDVVFLCLPHEISLAIVPQLVGRVGCVVDLSSAFRLRDATHYPRWYGFEHDQPELLAEAVYGLPELHRQALGGARLVATPGCYVTAATLALAPLARAGLVGADGAIVDAASGVTGAGRSATAATHFCTVDENLSAYALDGHRHTCEMEQEIGAQVLFTPHLVPMNRGILATCYARPPAGSQPSTERLLGVLGEAYAREPFVVVSESSPSTKATLGSNAVHLTARYDVRTGHAVVISALDNLTKGASGGAVQAANVALGLDETAGLTAVGMMP